MGDEVIKVLDALSEKFGIVIDWTQQNIQPYIQDLCHRVVQYELTTSIVSAVIWLCIVILCIVALWDGFKGFKKFDNYNDIPCIEGFIYTVIISLSMICIAIGIATIPEEINNIIQCAFLPEKIFIEELRSVIG